MSFRGSRERQAKRDKLAERIARRQRAYERPTAGMAFTDIAKSSGCPLRRRRLCTRISCRCREPSVRSIESIWMNVSTRYSSERHAHAVPIGCVALMPVEGA